MIRGATGARLVPSAFQSPKRSLKSWVKTIPALDTESLSRSEEAGRCPLLQLRVFGLGLLPDGNLGIGVFPEVGEIIAGGEHQDAIGIRSC